MALTGKRKMHSREEGLFTGRAAGRTTVTVGVMGTLATDTITVPEPDVEAKMLILATVIAGPAGIIVESAVPGARQIVFTIRNVGSGNSVGNPDLVIAYVGV